MSRETMKTRGVRGDNVVTNVDVRQGVLGSLAFDGNFPDHVETLDTDIAGTTDYALVVVGDTNAVSIDFELDFMFNGGKIGDTVAVTAAASTAGVATPTPVAGISDDQLAYATSVKVVMTSALQPDDYKVYLLKKAVLG